MAVLALQGDKFAFMPYVGASWCDAIRSVGVPADEPCWCAAILGVAAPLSPPIKHATAGMPSHL